MCAMSKAYCCDCMEAMRKMPDKCFDLAVVDPVYTGRSRRMKGTKKYQFSFFGFDDDAANWYTEKFWRAPDDGLLAKKNAVADAIDSMMIGRFEDRRRYHAALDAITDPEKKERFIAEWQDGRSILNDIGTFAHALAKRISQTEAEEKR